MNDGGEGGNKNKFMIPDEIKEMVAAAKCRDPVRRKLQKKNARKVRREFDASRSALSRGKIVQRPVVTKLWVNGQASEDRDGFPVLQRCPHF